MIKLIQLYCQLASQLSAFSSLNIPVTRYGPTIMIKSIVMCWVMLSSYLSKRSINTVHLNSFIQKRYNSYSQLATTQTLLNKQIQLVIQPRTQLYTQQLAMNLHVRTILSFLHSMSQQTWFIHYDQITGLALYLLDSYT